MQQTALIAGAGIAGLTLAYWLNHYGYRVTVVELTQKLRKGGAAVDVRSDALQIAERMNIPDKILDKRISTALEFVNIEGKSIVTLKNFGENNSDIELHRDDLTDIISHAGGTNVEYIFNGRISNISQNNHTVTVSFENRPTRSFDFVFGADGVHSSVRNLVFGSEAMYNHYFGAYFAILKKDVSLGKTNNGKLYNLPGKMAAISDGGNSMLLFRSPKLLYDYRDISKQKQILFENFAGTYWKIPEILKDMLDSQNLYFDEVCQIKMATWIKGRVALVGDAAHCTGFPTGMGTTLAMQGATMIADELAASNGDYQKAFSKYNESLLPVVELVQETIENGLDFLAPKTLEAISLRNEIMSQ